MPHAAAESEQAMCKTNNNNNNPLRNPIRIAALTHLTETLQSLTKDNGLSNLRDHEDFLDLCVYSVKIGAISKEEGRGFSHESQAIHAMHYRGRICDCLPHRCEDCGAIVPISMTDDIGGEITVCKACYEQQTDPRARNNEFVERGWDGRGDFEDTPAFQSGMPVELD